MAHERRRGRRPKSMGDTRAKILDAALAVLSRAGFPQATLRAVAREAEVDPALLLHYFGSREEMLFEAIRANLFRHIDRALDPGSRSAPIGSRVVDAFLSTWDPPERQRLFAAFVRAGISDERIGHLFREYIIREVVGLIAPYARADRARLRVGLSASQVIGLGLVRYIARFEPVATASRSELVAALGPTVDRYLRGSMRRSAPGSVRADRRRTPRRSGRRSDATAFPTAI